MELGQIQENKRLTDILFNYRPDQFIADLIAPPIKVDSRLFNVTTLNNAPFRIPNGKTGPRGKVEQIQIDASQNTYYVIDVVLEGVVDKIEQEAIADFDLLAETAETVKDDIKLIHDKDLSAVIFNASNYATGWKTQLLAGGQFNDAASNPLSIIKVGLRKVRKRVTDIVFGIKAWDDFTMHPTVLQVFGFTGGAQRELAANVTQDLVAKYFRVLRVHVGDQKYDSSAPGQTEVEADVWGPHVALLHQGQAERKSAQAHTLVFSETLDKAGNFFAKDPGPWGSEFVRAGWNRQIVVKNNKMGYYIEDASAA